MSKSKEKLPAAKPDALFDRIVAILEQARGNERVVTDRNIQYPMGTKSVEEQIQCPAGAELPPSFSSRLSWSHYRAIMRWGELRL